MKISGPRSQPVASPASEPKKESGADEGGTVVKINLGRLVSDARNDVDGRTARAGSGHSDNVQMCNYDPDRDGFDPKKQAPRLPKPLLNPSLPQGGLPGTRAINLKIGSGHADNVTRGPRGDAPSGGPQVEAGSLMTLLPRLREKFPGGSGSLPPGGVQTQATKIRIGTGHGDFVTQGENGLPGLQRPRPGKGDYFLSDPRPIDTGSLGAPRLKKSPLLTKDALLELDRPELSSKLVSKLSRAKSLEKVERLIRFLPPDLQQDILKLCRIRVGSGHTDNLQY